MAIKRPNPVLWVWYQYRGKLPDTYRDWVLHDATCKTWWLRVLVRGLVQIAPVCAVLFAALMIFGNGSWGLAVGSVVLGVLVSVRYTMTNCNESVDLRLRNHGFPPEYGSFARKQRDKAEREAEQARYDARWRR